LRSNVLPQLFHSGSFSETKHDSLSLFLLSVLQRTGGAKRRPRAAICFMRQWGRPYDSGDAHKFISYLPSTTYPGATPCPAPASPPVASPCGWKTGSACEDQLSDGPEIEETPSFYTLRLPTGRQNFSSQI
jgi:hypothetical protein